jgi:hypothetical protein
LIRPPTLEWIEGLREKDYLGKWTPIVEDQLEKKIGIKCPWDNANLPGYLTELLNELNDRTPYELTLQPWKCYFEYKQQIRVSQKKSDEAVLIQQIQLLALRQGKTVPGRPDSGLDCTALRVATLASIKMVRSAPSTSISSAPPAARLGR